MEWTLNQMLEIRIPKLFHLRVREDVTNVETFAETSVVQTQELLNVLESVCDNLRKSLHWQKTHCGSVRWNNPSGVQSADDVPGLPIAGDGAINLFAEGGGDE